jgi:hypothetical protein
MYIHIKHMCKRVHVCVLHIYSKPRTKVLSMYVVFSFFFKGVAVGGHNVGCILSSLQGKQ